jgi:CPA2 family monovalent cation:H+ antiporter-2
MMFGVGLHFAQRPSVRGIAIPARSRTTLSTLAGWLRPPVGWSLAAGLVLGLSISVASTVVLLRGLADNALVTTPHGRVAIGWLVFEDLATIAILVLMPVLVSGGNGNPLFSVGAALLKTAILRPHHAPGRHRVMTWLLTRSPTPALANAVHPGRRRLALGTAFAAFELFGVSLALGAFLAGVVIGESDIHHQVGAEVVPFRDFFAVLFFVSVGMLVDPAVVAANIGKVIVLSLLVVVGKAVITLLLGLVLPSSARTMIVVAAGLSQIGEFSFIVGQAGVALGLLDGDQYGLILAAAVVSIDVNPHMFNLIPATERALRRVPWLAAHGAQRADPERSPGTSKGTWSSSATAAWRHIGGVMQRRLPASWSSNRT